MRSTRAERKKRRNLTIGQLEVRIQVTSEKIQEILIKKEATKPSDYESQEQYNKQMRRYAQELDNQRNILGNYQILLAIKQRS